MSKSDNRQVRIPGPRHHDVADQCKKFGLKPVDEKKMLQLLGKHAPAHEIRSNAPPRAPRFR